MFCNVDEPMTSLRCYLHYIIDQFRNACDENNSIDSVKPFSFHATKNEKYLVRVTGLLLPVLTFREGVFEL